MNIHLGLGQPTANLDCGGKHRATPLSPETAVALPHKALSPLSRRRGTSADQEVQSLAARIASPHIHQFNNPPIHMNHSGSSHFDQARIEWAIRLKYSPMPHLAMDTIVTQLNAFRIGDLRQIGKTWEIMLERDGELAVNSDKRKADAAGLEWNVVSDGSPTGDRHAAALQYFYDNLTATHALEQDATGGVDELVYQVASAIDNRYSIHEMLLRVDNAAAREVTAEFRHTPIWFFECRRGYLGYLKHIFDVYGKPCINGEWLTAVNTGWMRPLSIAFAMKMLPLRDWLTFCQRYGSGYLEAITDAAIDSPEWNQAQEALLKLSNDGTVLHNSNVQFKFLEQSARNSLPFHPIVEMVNGLYAKCYRGVDLATGSRGAATGEKGTVTKGNPVGASIQKEESGIFLVRDAKWITGVFNERIDRPILRYLFNQEPRAWFALMPPLADTTEKDLASLQALVPMGLKIALKEVYKRFRWPVPEAGELVLGPEPNAAPAAGSANPPGATLGEEKKTVHHSNPAHVPLDAPIAPGAAINEALGADQIANPAMPDANDFVDRNAATSSADTVRYAERLAYLESLGLRDSQAARALRKALNS